MRNRIIGIDIIKVVATLFVVILHINGYIMTAHGVENASPEVVMLYQSVEGIAYIAVHLFVLSGSYLMCKKEYTSLNSILRIWLTTLVVTVLGLVLALCVGVRPNLTSAGQSIFPISLRAYGYISSYIVLMLLSPFFNMALKNMTDKQVAYVAIILTIVNVVFPTVIPFIGWGENYTVLFICLFFIAASINRINIRFPKNHKIYRGGVCIWLISTVFLILSPYLISYLSGKFSFLQRKSDYFFNYHNIIVIAESVGFFLWVTNNAIKIKKESIAGVITMFSNASLVVYLYHMHPVFKRTYNDLSLFEYLYSDNLLIYFGTIIGLSIGIYLIGVLLNYIVFKVVTIISNRILLFVKKHTKTKELLSHLKISIHS